MKKIKWSGDKLIGISALIVSLATLISLVYQARIMREHEIKSSFPKLELWTSRNGQDFKLQLVNTGLGPAILEDISVLYNDELYDLDHVTFYNKYMDSVENKLKYDQFRYSNISPGRIIPSGEKVDLLHAIRNSRKTDPFDSLFSSSADLIIKYSSVYEQLWEIKGFNALPKTLSEEPQVINSMLK